MDWAYYGSDVRPESTNYTANTGVGIASTANSNLDGTGTLAPIFTAGLVSAGFKGCLIKSIIIKATGSPTVDGMVRLYIQDTGSITKLFTEVPVPIVTQTGTARSFVHQIDFPEGFNLQAGYKILASTEKSNSFVIIVEGNDWKYPASGANGLLAKNFTPVSGTSVTTDEILHAHQIPAGVIAANDLLEVYANLTTSTAGGNTKIFKIWINTSNSLTSATLLGSFQMTTALSDSMSRLFPVISDTVLEVYGTPSTHFRNEYNVAPATSANVTVPSVSAGFWILISCIKAVAGDTDTVRWSMIRNYRV